MPVPLIKNNNLIEIRIVFKHRVTAARDNTGKIATRKIAPYISNDSGRE